MYLRTSRTLDRKPIRAMVLSLMLLLSAVACDAQNNDQQTSDCVGDTCNDSSDSSDTMSDTSVDADSVNDLASRPKKQSDTDTVAETDSTPAQAPDSDSATDTDPSTIIAADPSILPLPPVGMRWVLQADYSDEFNGAVLDSKKWLDYFTAGWKGRSPAKFVPWAVSVAGGNLKLQNGVLDEPDGDYKYYGGAVTSVGESAHYGYYESKFIASRTRMSSTFWMSNRKADYGPDACSNDRYSQELDIQECIGSAGEKGAGMQSTMGSNTHYRYVHCDASRETFYSATPPRIDLATDVAEDYHTYGAWWRDDKHVTFFADNSEGATQWFSTQISDTPFDRPMFLCMVTETYDWTSPVLEWELKDAGRNTTYYDWVRAWRLVPSQKQLPPWDYDTPLLTESLSVSNVEIIGSGAPKLSFDYAYQANVDRVMLVTTVADDGSISTSQSFPALQGYGYATVQLDLPNTPETGGAQLVVVTLQKNETLGTAPIASEQFSL